MSAAARQVLAADTVEALPLAAAGMLAVLTRVAADGGVLALGRSYDGNPWEVGIVFSMRATHSMGGRP